MIPNVGMGWFVDMIIIVDKVFQVALIVVVMVKSSSFDSTQDICCFLFLWIAPPKCSGYDWHCCRWWDPCDEGQGDCDNDNECKDGLVCGHEKGQINYCGPTFPHNFDCCVRPETINPVPVPTKPPVKPPSPTCPPVPQNPILRFVLSWNVLTDLDHHIKVFESGGKEICHLYYGNKYCFGAFLHDDLEEVCRMF